MMPKKSFRVIGFPFVLQWLNKSNMTLWLIALALTLPSFKQPIQYSKCGQLNDPLANYTSLSSTTPIWGCPQLNAGEKFTQHSAYSVSYNHKHMQANWVAYELTLSHTWGIAERESRFSIDPIIKPHTARTEDYTKSGFDRGHLAPAADMKYSSQAMLESFYTSNISPQRPGLNRGIWKQLEEKIRTWAPSNRPLFIVTGPVLKDSLTQFIGTYNRVSVPKRFYKVLLDTAKPMRAIGFVFDNQGSQLPLTHFAMSIDAVEKITGLNFFPLLEKSNQSAQAIAVESTLNTQRWNWN
jgi:endonuclease G